MRKSNRNGRFHGLAVAALAASVALIVLWAAGLIRAKPYGANGFDGVDARSGKPADQGLSASSSEANRAPATPDLPSASGAERESHAFSLINIEVVDPDGFNAPVATVRLRDQADPSRLDIEQSTDETGIATIAAPTGRLYIASCETVDSFAKRANIIPGQHVRLTLQVGRRIRVLVVDSQASPCPASTVAIVADQRYIGVGSTNARGITDDLWVPQRGDIAATVYSDIAMPTSARASTQELGAVWTVTLTPAPHEVKGLVRRDGLPLPGAIVRDTNRQTRRITRTDSNGAFTLGRYGENALDLVISHSAALFEVRRVHTNALQDPIIVDLKPGRSIEVAVVNPSGNPVEGALAECLITTGTTNHEGVSRTIEVKQQARTTSYGRCILAGLPENARQIVVTHGGFPAKIYELQPGETSIDVRLDRAESLTWFLKQGERQEPMDLQNWALTMTRLSSDGSIEDIRLSSTSDLSGRIRFDTFHPGRYSIHWMHAHGLWDEFENKNVSAGVHDWTPPEHRVVIHAASEVSGSDVFISGDGWVSRPQLLYGLWRFPIRPGDWSLHVPGEPTRYGTTTTGGEVIWR